MRGSIPITFTQHAKERLERLPELNETQVIKDIQKHIYNLKKERGGKAYYTASHTAKYILDKDLNVITIMTMDQNVKTKHRKYLGQQWIQLSKREIQDIIIDIQAKKDPTHWKHFLFSNN